VSTGSKPHRAVGQELWHSFLCGIFSTRFSLSSGQHYGKEDTQDAGAWAERVRRETKTEPVVLKPGEGVDVKAAR
jgi:hypothetical protein